MGKSKRALELESEIQSRIYRDNQRTSHFEYNEVPDMPASYKMLQLVATTYNSVNGESFVLKTVTGKTEEDCLDALLKYLDLIKKDPMTYTVTWRKKGEGMPSQKSYFYCNDLMELAEKFYYGKVREEYIVEEVKLMPIS
jgi:hypothetical protein